MDANLEAYKKLEAEAVALVEESKQLDLELDREGLSPSESQVLFDRIRALRKATVAFTADPDRKKLLEEVKVEFERELAKVIQRHNDALKSLADNAARIAKDPTNGYNAKAIVTNSNKSRRTRRSKRSDGKRSDGKRSDGKRSDGKRSRSRTTRR